MKNPPPYDFVPRGYCFVVFFFQPRDCESLGLNGPMAFDYRSPCSAFVVCCYAVLSDQTELAYGKRHFISKQVAYLTPRA